MIRDYIDNMVLYYDHGKKIERAQAFGRHKELPALLVERNALWEKVTDAQKDIAQRLSKGEKIYRLHEILHRGEGSMSESDPIADLSAKVNALLELLLEDIARSHVPRVSAEFAVDGKP